MPVRTFDPKQTVFIAGGIPIGGFADGTFIAVERSNDTFSKVSGADGIVSRAKSNDLSGTITITLAQTSPSNDILTGFAQADEQTNNGVIPLSVSDLSGRANFVSAFGWVRKMPNAEFGKEITDREWVFDCADLNWFMGGNADAE
jgi:hypothetical protein